MANRRIKKGFCAALLALLVSVSAGQAQDAVSDLLGRVNSLRSSLGLTGYTLNSALSGAAQSQAEWMAQTGSVSHTRPDGSSPRSRAAAYGYSSTYVSENIYMGGLASANTAWSFWVNSPIHYAGLTSTNYTEIGIGISTSGTHGTAYVLVFGNPAGYVAPPRSSSSGTGSTSSSKPPPSFVVGQDQYGNIKHQIQEGDTLGDILLIYGYTWADLPYILQLNGLTEADYRQLEIGGILLVPPKDGTYTPTPDLSTPTPDITATPQPTATPTASATPKPLNIATAQTVPESVLAVANAPLSPTPQPPPLTAVAFAPTQILVERGTIIPNNQASPWLVVAVVVQIGIVIVAGIEFVRRSRR